MTPPSLSPGELSGMIRLLRKTGGEITVTAEGYSMRPLFSGPARLRVACGDNREFRPGTVILFMGDGVMVVHRVLALANNGRFLITRGDNNIAIDRPVPLAAVLGVVSGFVDRDTRSWDDCQPPETGLISRALISIGKMHFNLAWGIASVSIFIQWALRRAPRLSVVRGA